MRQDAFVAGAMGFVCVMFLVLVGLLVAIIFYLLTLYRALTRVSRRNRLMEPGMVWLYLIPLFNIVWSFFLVIQVPASLRNEFRHRDQDDGSDYGRGIGLAYAIVLVAAWPFAILLNVLGAAMHTPVLGMLIWPVDVVGLVLWILFWVKIAGYSKQLAEGGLRGDDDFDDDESRRRRRRRAADDFDEDDDRPRARRRRDEEDFDDEDRPRRRRRISNDEVEEEPPPRKPRRRQEEIKAELISEAPRAKPKLEPPPAPPGPIVVECGECQKKLRVPPEVVGKKVKCPGCGATFVAG